MHLTYGIGARPLHLIAHFALLFTAFWMLNPGPVSAREPACPHLLSLDGLELDTCIPFLSNPQFVVPDASNAIQLAYAVDSQDPDVELTIAAIPFGTRSGTEALPIVTAATDMSAVRAWLRDYRLKQGGQPQAGGSTAMLFGRVVESLVSVVNLPGAKTDRPTRVTEWISTAGSRLWVIRVAQKLSQSGSGQRIVSPSGLVVSSPDADLPSSSLASRTLKASADRQSAVTTAAGDLPTPAWWNGPCDTYYYHAHSGGYYAFPLGTVYRGVDACGPRPAFREGPDVGVYFYPGSYGALEWECVELSLRFMYLAYGVAPYPGNGNQLVRNYSGTVLDKINNGIPGVVPAPGDVLSYCSSCTFGHTSVVMTSAVNASGNGGVTVIEENNSYSGKSTLTVTNWIVYGNSGPVIGWLHLRGSPAPVLSKAIFLPILRR